MWKRLRRAVSSNLERFRDDPLLRDPGALDASSLAADLQTLRAQVELLEGDRRRLSAEEEVLAARIRAALGAGRRSEGLDHAETLSRVRRDLALVDGQLERARAALRRGEGVQRELTQAALAPRSEPVPRAEPADLVARAEDTVSRLERELSTRPGPGPDADPGAGPGAGEAGTGAPSPKTLGGEGVGGDSGGTRIRAEKTLGEERPEGGVEVEARSTAKTLGVDARPSRADILDELERLGRLREQGVLDEAEFSLAKKKLLGL